MSSSPYLLSQRRVVLGDIAQQTLPVIRLKQARGGIPSRWRENLDLPPKSGGSLHFEMFFVTAHF